MNDIIEVLKFAKNTISRESKWCKGRVAQNYLGNPTHTGSFWACKRCASGAVAFAGIKLDKQTWTAMDLLDSVSKEMYEIRSVIEVNDDLGFEAVHKVFDTAIARAIEAEDLKAVSENNYGHMTGATA